MFPATALYLCFCSDAASAHIRHRTTASGWPAELSRDYESPRHTANENSTSSSAFPHQQPNQQRKLSWVYNKIIATYLVVLMNEKSWKE